MDTATIERSDETRVGDAGLAGLLRRALGYMERDDAPELWDECWTAVEGIERVPSATVPHTFVVARYLVPTDGVSELLTALGHLRLSETVHDGPALHTVLASIGESAVCVTCGPAAAEREYAFYAFDGESPIGGLLYRAGVFADSGEAHAAAEAAFRETFPTREFRIEEVDPDQYRQDGGQSHGHDVVQQNGAAT
jgi:hypothetical protein